MAKAFEDFVHADLPRRLRRIERIESAVHDVLASFHMLYDGGKSRWPYDVKHATVPAATHRSDSTNAMVQFMLSVFTRPTPSARKFALLTPLLQRVPRLVKVPSSLTKVAETSRLALETHYATAPSTTSGSFGGNDPLTLCWLLESDIPLQSDLISATDGLLDRAARDPNIYRLNQDINKADAHAFPLLRIAHLAQKRGIAKACDLTLLRAWFIERLHLHLSYADIPDTSFDAAELLFCLEGILVCDPYVDAIDRVIDRAFIILAEKQAENPNLRPYRPFASDAKGFALLPLTVEVFSSLLRVSERLDTPGHSHAKWHRRISRMVERYTDWLLSNRQEIEVPGIGTSSGWNSEHTHTSRVLHVWETSQVLVFLIHTAQWLRRHLEFDIVKVAGLSSSWPKRDIFMPSEPPHLALAEPSQKDPAYKRLYEAFIDPWRSPAATKPMSYSALLYGPPGTGKTTFAKYIAAELGWELLMLSPSDFVVGGEANVEQRAKNIFLCLQELTEKVILLDEIDRLILHRDSTQYARQGDTFQFMTPGMLTKLNTLREKKRSIFLIATNYAEKIDPAIKREGRIDFSQLIQLPDKAKRRQLVLVRLAELALARTIAAPGEDRNSSAFLSRAATSFGLDSIAPLFGTLKIAAVPATLDAIVDEVSMNSVGMTIKAVTSRAEKTFAQSINATEALNVLKGSIIYPAGDVKLDSYRDREKERDGFPPAEEAKAMRELFAEAGRV